LSAARRFGETGITAAVQALARALASRGAPSPTRLRSSTHRIVTG